MSNHDDFAEEVRRRKEYAERKIRERHEALRKEEEHKRRISMEVHRERVQKELRREQESLQRRMQQLEADAARKKVIMEKQHQATSRTAANKSPKAYAFGSSTPRDLSYLDNLPRSEKAYDKKLSPLAEHPTKLTSPSGELANGRSSTPAANGRTPFRTSMTTSLYVSSAPVSRNRPSPPKASKPIKSSMTQSVYVPTPTRPKTAAVPLATRNKFPARPQSTTDNSRDKKNELRPRTKPDIPSPLPRSNPHKKDTKAPTPPKKIAELKSVANNVSQAKAECLISNSTTPVAETKVAPKLEEESKHVNDVSKRDVLEIVAEQLKANENEESNELTATTRSEVETESENKEDAVLINLETEAEIDVDESLDAEKSPMVSKEAIVEHSAVEQKSQSIEKESSNAEEHALVHLEPEMIRDKLGDVASEVEAEITSMRGENELTALFGNDFVGAVIPSSEEETHNDELAVVNGNAETHMTNGSSFITKNESNNHVTKKDEAVDDEIVHWDHNSDTERNEETDSGKASPTASEASAEDAILSAIDASKPIRQPEPSTEQLERAREAEERRARVAAILAKSRGMDLAASGQVSPPSVLKVDQETPPSPAETEIVSDSGVASSNASDVLKRLASTNNIPSLQKFLQRKQGSAPSLQADNTNSSSSEVLP